MSTHAQLRERAALLSDLRQIVQAMKNMAFAELQRIARELPAQTLACETVLDVLLPLLRDEQPQASAPGPDSVPAVWLVIGAERGFCSGFNAQLAAAVSELRRTDPQATLLLASRRLVELLGEEMDDVSVLPGCAGIEDADAALDSWLDAAGRHMHSSAELWLLHAASEGLVRRRLLPRPDASGTARSADSSSAAVQGPAPQLYLPRPVLCEALLLQSTRLLLRAGLYASLAKENHWRLTQMQRAQDHLDELGRDLRRRYALQRQSEITNELETLMSSMDGASTGLQAAVSATGP